MVFGSEIRDPRSGIRDPGSGKNLFRIPDPGVKKHPIPDPDPQHCRIHMFLGHPDPPGGMDPDPDPSINMQK